MRNKKLTEQELYFKLKNERREWWKGFWQGVRSFLKEGLIVIAIVTAGVTFIVSIVGGIRFFVSADKFDSFQERVRELEKDVSKLHATQHEHSWKDYYQTYPSIVTNNAQKFYITNDYVTNLFWYTWTNR